MKTSEKTLNLTLIILLLAITKVTFNIECTLANNSQQPTQGSLYIGKAPANSEIRYKGKKTPVLDNGDFVIGFGDDADKQQFYTVISNDGTQTKKSVNITTRKYNIQRINGISNKYMAPSTESLKRIRDENRMVAKSRQQFSNQTDFIKSGFIWPLNGPITGVYGSQRIFNGKPRRPHYGLDIAAPEGTPVYAPASGKVILFHPNMYFSGGTLIINHGLGVSSTFIHLKKSLVKEGDTVEQGQAIAEVGATGRVTGAHLDWRVNWYQTRLDPQLLVPTKPKTNSKTTKPNKNL